MDWTPSLIQRLRDLWAEGHSTAEIGRRMRISRNAVIGKAHRIALAGRPSPIKKQRSEFVPPPDSIPRLRGVGPFSAEEDAVLLRYPQASARWLNCILVDRTPAQIWARRDRLSERGLRERPKREPRPVVQPTPKPTIAAPSPRPAPTIVLPPTRGQCQYLHGDRAPYRQCDNPAILLRADGSVCPEGAVWCSEHRRQIYCRTRDLAA